MSYTVAYKIDTDGKLEEIAEFSNSHGFGPFVWGAISDKYFGDEFAWMSHVKEIWPMWKDPRVPKHWSIALLVTYDRAVIEYERFKEVAKALRDFVTDVGIRGRACHLLAIADLLEKSNPCKGMCFYGTSLSDNPWYEWDNEKEENLPYDFDKEKKHFFVGKATDERQNP